MKDNKIIISAITALLLLVVGGYGISAMMQVADQADSVASSDAVVGVLEEAGLAQENVEEETEEVPETTLEPTETTQLTSGPMSPGEHGPFSASDRDNDGSVTRAEIEAFMDQGPERRIGLVAFFDQEDVNGDSVIDAAELAVVDPAFAFDGTDANADGEVSRVEVEEYVEEPGRLYRKIGLGEFFDMVDTDGNDVVDPDEIEAAHVSGILDRG